MIKTRDGDNRINRRLVRDVLRYLAKRGAYLTTSRSQKLLYLIERQCVLRKGVRSLGLDFKHDRFGMYSPGLKGIFMTVSTKDDQLRLTGVQSERGYGRMIEWVGGGDEVRLPEDVERAADHILHLCGYLNTPNLIALAKSTSPFVHSKGGEYLDWETLKDERCEEDEELTDEGEGRLEKSLRSVRDGNVEEFESVDALVTDLFGE